MNSAEPFSRSLGAGDGVRRGLEGHMASGGQTGWRGRSWEGTFFLGMAKRRMMERWVLWLMEEGQNKGVPRVD